MTASPNHRENPMTNQTPPPPDQPYNQPPAQNYQHPQGGFQPGTYPPGPGGAAAAPGPARKGTLGLIALVIAIAGFIFALVPGAMVIGWILLPIAFILAIVTFFLRDQKKVLAIIALIVSIVGTIAGALATLVAISNAFTEASGGAVTAAPPAATSEAGTTTTEAAAQSSDEGTRENPYPLGTAIANDEWSVVVNSFDAAATDQVLAENEFNEEPPAGETYALANVTITRVAAEAQTPMMVTVEYVTASGNVIGSWDNPAVAPDAVDSNELYEGATVTGNLVFLIPEGDAGSLRVTPGLFTDEVFVALS